MRCGMLLALAIFIIIGSIIAVKRYTTSTSKETTSNPSLGNKAIPKANASKSKSSKTDHPCKHSTTKSKQKTKPQPKRNPTKTPKAKQPPQPHRSNPSSKKKTKMPDYTPVDKLEKNYHKIHNKANKKFAILLTTGAMNPIHLGHTDIMETAKRAIEKDQNIKVIAGFISPTHEIYLKDKARTTGMKLFPAADRLKMVQLATSNSDWLSCDEWECKQKQFINFPDVAQQMAKKIKQKILQRIWIK